MKSPEVMNLGWNVNLITFQAVGLLMFTTSNINQGYQPRAHSTQDPDVRKLKGHLLRSWFPERLPELDEPDETQWQFQDLSYLRSCFTP